MRDFIDVLFAMHFQGNLLPRSDKYEYDVSQVNTSGDMKLASLTMETASGDTGQIVKYTLFLERQGTIFHQLLFIGLACVCALLVVITLLLPPHFKTKYVLGTLSDPASTSRR